MSRKINVPGMIAGWYIDIHAAGDADGSQRSPELNITVDNPSDFGV
jgi:hypothetical protein